MESNNTLIETYLKQGNVLPLKKYPVFIPTWDNQPEAPVPVLTIKGSPVLTYQNISVLIAQPGYGKSSICEAILSGVVSKDAKCLGIAVRAKKALYIDCERTDYDVHASWRRMVSRVGAGYKDGAVVFMGMRMVSSLEDRKRCIEQVLTEQPDIDLLIVDGAGDLVMDTNSLQEANEVKVWMRSLTAQYALSILTTLHPNPTDNKPRGHLGSEMLREAESILCVEVNGGVRKLTTDFKHGKNRNGGSAETFFKWCEDEGMMVETTADDYMQGQGADGVVKSPCNYFTEADVIQNAVDAVMGRDAYVYADLTKRWKDYITKHHPKCRAGNNGIQDLVKALTEQGYLLKAEGAKFAVYQNANPPMLEA